MLAQCSDICPQLVAHFGEGVETFDMDDIVEGGESLVGQLFEDPEPQAEALCYPNTFSRTARPRPCSSNSFPTRWAPFKLSTLKLASV